MDELLSDLLVLARLEGRPPQTGAEVSAAVAPIVEEAVVKAARTVDRPQVRISAQVDEDVEAVVPAAALRMIVGNLVENATRHAHSQVTVSVSTVHGSDARGNRFLEIAVDDDGPGVPDSERDHIFERFVQLDPSRNAPGFGLGLAIVRQVAEQAGAHIAVSGSPLGGARFSVRFPEPGPSEAG